MSDRDDVKLYSRNVIGTVGGQSCSFAILPLYPLELTSRLMTLAAEVLKSLQPDTEALYLINNREFRHDGLKALVQGMIGRKEPEWRLERILIYGCGLGGASRCVPRLTSCW